MWREWGLAVSAGTLQHQENQSTTSPQKPTLFLFTEESPGGGTTLAHGGSVVLQEKAPNCKHVAEAKRPWEKSKSIPATSRSRG